MIKFDHIRQQLKLGVKALQSTQLSLQMFTRFKESFNANDDLALMSYFHSGVIKYAAPFLEIKVDNKKTRYPHKHLSKIAGFDLKIHNHLIDLRNRILAHDDCEAIEPKILTGGPTLQTGDHIPINFYLTSATMSHTSNLDDLQKIIAHINATFEGIGNKLSDDIKAYREMIINDPNAIRNSKYQKRIEPVKKNELDQSIIAPDISQDSWLNLSVAPDLQVLNGYVYKWVRVEKHFIDGEIITLPSGQKITINKPNAS